MQSGIGEILKDKKIKNLVDYVTGVEVGLDSNARKNRVGTLIENLVEVFVADTCDKLNLPYLAQATADKIKTAWNINITVDKSKRILDFAINNNGKLYFMEQIGLPICFKTNATSTAVLNNIFKAKPNFSSLEAGTCLTVIENSTRKVQAF